MLYKRLFIRVLFPIESNARVVNVRMRGLPPSTPHLVTFRKDERDFSPSTQYRDYPISRTKLHWESQSDTSQSTPTGQNYIHFKDRGYTILFFARLDKRQAGVICPFIYLGPAKELLNYEANRPISMTWELDYPISAELFEEARSV